MGLLSKLYLSNNSKKNSNKFDIYSIMCLAYNFEEF